MCGIYGVFAKSEGVVPIDSVLRELSVQLTHRGPDEHDQILFAKGGIGTRRLSIVSPISNQQPVHNEDQSIWAVMNGEIYNYETLRQELSKSHEFYQDGDTEILVHLYEEYGDQMAEHLQGMYAIALWDNRTHRLMMLRDRFGEKPLYFLQASNWIAFASELGALLSLPDFHQCLEPTALLGYMSFGFIPGSSTLVKQIRKLEPGTIAYFDQGMRFYQRKYWLMPEPVDDVEQSTDYDSTITKLTLQLQQACVHLYRMSASPVGLFLSGGLDSSVIAALLAASGFRDIQAFTLDYPDLPEFADAKYASQVANHHGLRLHLVKVTREDFWNAFPKLLKHIDEPCDDPTGIPLLLLSQYAAQYVRVVLCGAGADELFGGYEVHWDAIQSSLSLVDSARQGNSLWSHISLLDQSRVKRLFNPETIAHFEEQGILADAADRFGVQETNDPVWNVLASDLKYRLPGQLLALGDRLTMAASVEARSPFLTKQVAEMSIRLPSTWKIDRKKRKGILRDLAKPFLPIEIIQRAKQGLPSPLLTDWFDAIVIPRWQSLRTDLPFSFMSVFNESAIETIESQWRKGNPLARKMLWRLTLLAAWLRQNQVSA